MPPKRKATTLAPAGSVAKRSSTRARRPPTRPGDGSPLPPASPIHRDPNAAYEIFNTTLLNYQQGVADQLNDFDANLQSNTRQLDEVTTLLAAINQRLDAMGPTQPPAHRSGTSPVPARMQQHDYLSHWTWVERPCIEDIANGEFDIYDLPKLHRDEYLRNLHTTKSVEGVMHPLSGARPHVVQARTKLQSSFKNLDTFLSAWLIYVSIRMVYAPEYGPGLACWTERIVSYARLNYDFSTIVNYVVAYFQKHQNSPPTTWFSADTELHTEHLGNAAQRAVNTLRTSSPVKSSANPASPFKSQPISEQICNNWNRATGCKVKEKSGNDCLRRHVCSKCNSASHRNFECTST
jgi:hypothetical protein